MSRTQERDFVDQSFCTRDFVRTLSYREFVTSFSLALLFVACLSLINYYSDHDWIKIYKRAWVVIILLLTLSANHVFYKIDHRRQNNFIGRNLHDYIFVLICATLFKLRSLVYGYEIEGDGGFVVLMILAAVFMVFIFEFVIAIIKRVLKLFRWQIL